MSVFTEFRVPADDFELGRVLGTDIGNSHVVELETMVPLGERAVPYFRVSKSDRDVFVNAVRDHPSVTSLTETDDVDGQALFSMEWETHRDELIQGLVEYGVQLLNGRAEGDSWVFEFRFSTHEDLGAFREYCAETGIDLEMLKLYNPGIRETDRDTDPWFGLTAPQYEALTLAVRDGYYHVPRDCSTSQLATEMGISEQAVSERLRRAITALVTNTLLESESD